MGILPSYWEKSRTSRVCVTSCHLLSDRVNQAARWAVGRANRIHLSVTWGCQPKSHLCPKGCCLTAVKTSAVISSIWQTFGQILCPWLGRPELWGHAGYFFAFFFLWNPSIWAPSSPLWLFGWLLIFFYLSPLAINQNCGFVRNFLQRTFPNIWIWKQESFPSKILTYWSHASSDPCTSATYKISRTQEFNMKVRIVHMGQSMLKDHWGVYIYWFRVVQSAWVFYARRFSHQLKVFNFKLVLEVFPACNPSITPFGQCRFPWNHAEKHWWGQWNKYVSACTAYILLSDCIMKFSFLVKESEMFLITWTFFLFFF